MRSGVLRRQNMGHNILWPTALEGAELGTGHPNILGFEELQTSPATTTCRIADVAPKAAARAGSGPG